MEIFIRNKISLLQQIRAIHSIAEVINKIYLPASESKKLRLLTKYFNVNFYENHQNLENIPDLIQIKHDIPLTTIGAIHRPLLFPNQIFNKCKSLWKKKRKQKFVFFGLITDKRKYVLEVWLNKFAAHKVNTIQTTESNNSKIKKHLFRILGIHLHISTKVGPLKIISSMRGRYFPYKVWDTNYYKSLCNAQYVLCPNGDFVWSYRFFESILCGAIPIVEDECEAYKGFKYKYLSDDPELFTWSEEDAQFNFQLAKMRLTIDKELLINELENLISNNS